jgi:thiamine kinase-like enzyme
MRIAEHLHKSVEEVMQLSVLEIQLWYEWFVLQHEKGKEAMTSGRANSRNPRIR